MSAKLSWKGCSSDAFVLRLQRHVPLELDVTINNNRSTMLSISARRYGYARLSIHQMFLEAPDSVVEAVARYIRGRDRRKKETNFLIRSYIENNLGRYSKRESRLETKGRVYDLQGIFSRLQEEYFPEPCDLAIGWFGDCRPKKRVITLGQYLSSAKTIKIHRLLDDTFLPPYFVEFVVYHEMVHHVVPGYYDARGHLRIHGREFREREKKFKEYDRAMAWEKRNKEVFFHGRT
ncbi:MAG: hypothetical protein ACKVOH_03350 [Chlamydiales bacterium]